jgi:hypothetical protein
VLCEDFDWPPVCTHCWTEVVHLYELGSAIAVLTAGDQIHVKCLDVLLWVCILQILEDAAATAPRAPSPQRGRAQQTTIHRCGWWFAFSWSVGVGLPQSVSVR